MPPVTPEEIVAIITLVEKLIEKAPEVVADLQSVLTKEKALPSDWVALRAKIYSRSYESLVPESQIPPGQ